MSHRSLLPWCALLLGWSGRAHAQVRDSIAPACATPAHRALDFWVGQWRVESGGQEVGRNVIRRAQAGCLITEEWRAANGQGGQSMNFFSPTTGSWHQVWVDDGGTVLQLRGTAQAGAMVYRGETRTARGHFVHRLALRQQEDGSVRQLWESWPAADTSDAARRVAFDGIYRRVP
ncbi:MAG: hypothetical protein MUE41_19055 [Gemmatimonadaceae bacterium]|jgi:hypothetical protein|nr:hypothetical protein [Gemmatimonadaceae bacterium]